LDSTINNDDKDLFIAKKIISPHQAVVIVSEGVNLGFFSPDKVSDETIRRIRKEFDADDDTVVVGCCPGRNIWSKGIREFVKMAKEAERWPEKVRFVLVGSSDGNSRDAVPQDYYCNVPTLRHFDRRSDIRDVIASLDVLAHPSYYREGVPRILLEGLAMQKPAVTTDSVGCRETVEDGINGFLVPIKDAQRLSEAVQRLVRDKQLRLRFGEAGFRKAQNEFDVHKINKRVLAEVFQISCNSIDD